MKLNIPCGKRGLIEINKSQFIAELRSEVLVISGHQLHSAHVLTSISREKTRSETAKLIMGLKRQGDPKILTFNLRS